MTLSEKLRKAEECWKAFRNSQLNTISFIKISDEIPKFCYMEGYHDAVKEFTGLTQLRDWLRGGMTPPSNIAFTAGIWRDLAWEIEQALADSPSQEPRDYEKLLDEFITKEREKSRMGSGDDMFYELQIKDYVDKQRPFWIEFIKFIENAVLGCDSAKEENRHDVGSVPSKAQEPKERKGRGGK